MEPGKPEPKTGPVKGFWTRSRGGTGPTTTGRTEVNPPQSEPARHTTTTNTTTTMVTTTTTTASSGRKCKRNIISKHNLTTSQGRTLQEKIV